MDKFEHESNFLAKFDHLSSRLFHYQSPNWLVSTLLYLGTLRKSLVVRALQDCSSFLGFKTAKLLALGCLSVCFVPVNHP